MSKGGEGNCYQLAAEYLRQERPDGILVHALIHRPHGSADRVRAALGNYSATSAGLPIMHAWVELPEGLIYDRAWLHTPPHIERTAAYRALVRPVREWRYTLQEAKQWVRATMIYGPWNELA